jgi:glycosyltransferase involved in cell wall biosynthesis
MKRLDETVKKLVSVIVPIYNVERFIERCVQSISGQDYENVEIILVNDGSSDCSGEIIDSLQMTDKRIRVIHHKNAGVSVARNVGLKYAQGEYVVFVDGDDYIEKNYVSYFVKLIETTDTDVALSYQVLHDDEEPACQPEDFSTVSSTQAMVQLYLNKTGVAVWNKIYRRAFLEDHKIRFNEDYWFAEGMTFNIACFAATEQVGTANFRVYHQVTNRNSAVRKFNLESWHCGKRAMEYQKTLWKTFDKRVLDAWNYHYREYNFNILKGLCQTDLREEHAGEIKNCVNGLKRKILYPWRVDIGKRAKLKSLLVAAFPIQMAKRDIVKEQRAYFALRRKNGVEQLVLQLAKLGIGVGWHPILLNGKAKGLQGYFDLGQKLLIFGEWNQVTDCLQQIRQKDKENIVMVAVRFTESALKTKLDLGGGKAFPAISDRLLELKEINPQDYVSFYGGGKSMDIEIIDSEDIPDVEDVPVILVHTEKGEIFLRNLDCVSLRPFLTGQDSRGSGSVDCRYPQYYTITWGKR